MKNQTSEASAFDENQSIQVIRDMIEVSRKNLKNDGILFITWGWILFASVAARYLLRVFIVSQEIVSYTNKIILVLLGIGVLISANYIYKSRNQVTTYTGKVLRFLWGAIIVLNLYILAYQLNAHMRIDMLYSQYMLFLALGTFVTGAVIKFKPLIICSFTFIILAQAGFFLKNETTILLSAISFITGLAIPGHILFANRKK